MKIFSTEMNVMMRKMNTFIMGIKKIKGIFQTDLIEEKDH